MKLLLSFTLSILLLAGLVQPSLAYSTNAGTIVDNLGNPIQLRGVNWFGFETQNHAVHGLWARNYLDMINQMKSVGVNAVRLPVCPGTLRALPVEGIDYTLNPDLENLNGIQVLDKIVTSLNDAGIYVLLGIHNPDCAAISELWYTWMYQERFWINDLVLLSKRYANQPYFIGIDLKNEPHGAATWGSGDIRTDWNLAAERASAAVLAANPNLLVFVQGVHENKWCSSVVSHWWGGNFEPLRCGTLNIPKTQLVLSPHVYGPDVYLQYYFYSRDFPGNMPMIWKNQFGFTKNAGYTIAVGEFGGKYGNGGHPLDILWQDAFINYLRDENIQHSFYWSWNPNSTDTGGILQDDWITLNTNKVGLLQRLWAPPALPEPPTQEPPSEEPPTETPTEGTGDPAGDPAEEPAETPTDPAV